MSLVTLSTCFQGDLTGTSGLLIMEFMQDDTCDSHIKQNWK